MSLAHADATPKPSADLAAVDLSHIPGEEGWPLVGNTFRLLADPKGEVARMAARYGPVYRTRAFGLRTIALLGPEANEFVLFDRQKLFSSAQGWNPLLERLFPRGLMLLDFDEHRVHRKALSVAFKAEPMRAYLAGLNAGIARGVADWRARPGEMLFYPAIKQLTLDLAATSFFGRELGPDMEALKRAFVDMVAASVAVVRAPLPGTLMARGVKGRQFMVAFLGREVETRRNGGGDDLFSQLCRASTDDGRLLSAREIVDHMSFLMMAAHDTLTSSLTSFVWLLAANPGWQARLREEIASLGPGPLAYERLDDLRLTEMAFKEALRLIPPVPTIPRRALREAQFGGFRIPAGARVTVNPMFTHHMPGVWPEPETFDPLRFSEANAQGRHKYAFVPYGGGAHMCLGLHFAYMQAKCFARHFLSSVEASVAPGYAPQWRMWPIPKPADGLRLRLRPLN
ncbi:MAG: cytochrome P450 [Pseudomonadota bacterium]|nr:cytochrome P450 [Pseudomonadota bacterium]